MRWDSNTDANKGIASLFSTNAANRLDTIFGTRQYAAPEVLFILLPLVYYKTGGQLANMNSGIACSEIDCYTPLRNLPTAVLLHPTLFLPFFMAHLSA